MCGGRERRAGNIRTVRKLHLFQLDKLGSSFHQVRYLPKRLDAQELHTEPEQDVAQALTDLPVMSAQ